MEVEINDKKALALHLLAEMFNSKTLKERARAVKSFYHFLIAELRDTTFNYDETMNIIENAVFLSSIEAGQTLTHVQIKNSALDSFAVMLVNKLSAKGDMPKDVEKKARDTSYDVKDVFFAINHVVNRYSKKNLELWVNSMRGILNLIASKCGIV